MADPIPDGGKVFITPGDATFSVQFFANETLKEVVLAPGAISGKTKPLIYQGFAIIPNWTNPVTLDIKFRDSDNTSIILGNNDTALPGNATQTLSFPQEGIPVYKEVDMLLTLSGQPGGSGGTIIFSLKASSNKRDATALRQGGGGSGNIEDGTANGQLTFWDNAGTTWRHTENTELVWDDTNKNVGVGISTPQEKLAVAGNIVSAGIKWEVQTSPVDRWWDGVVWGNNRFVAVARLDAQVGNRAMVSPDGKNWKAVTTPTSPVEPGWASVAYGNGLFVAVSPSGFNENVMISSDGGETWELISTPTSNFWYGVAYGNGLFVAVAGSGTGNRVMTSPDGINWTIRTSPADNSWLGITYGNGLFVAVAATGTGNRIMTSPDGINWTIRTSPADNNWTAITYGNGLFVAVASSGTGNRVMTSPDGINWTLRNSAADNSWAAVTYGNGLFVAVATSGTGNRVMTSANGINWITQNSPVDNAWLALTYGNGLFIATSKDGTGNRIMISGKQKEKSSQSANNHHGQHTFYGGLRYNAYRTISAPVTISMIDHQIEISSGTFNQNLPSAVNQKGRILVFDNAGAGTITLVPNGAETIDGNPTLDILAGEVVKIISNGSNWRLR